MGDLEIYIEGLVQENTSIDHCHTDVHKNFISVHELSVANTIIFVHMKG